MKIEDHTVTDRKARAGSSDDTSQGLSSQDSYQKVFSCTEEALWSFGRILQEVRPGVYHSRGAGGSPAFFIIRS